jgi:hypothetical protein
MQLVANLIWGGVFFRTCEAILLTQYNDGRSEVIRVMESFFASSILLPDDKYNGFTELIYHVHQMLQLLIGFSHNRSSPIMFQKVRLFPPALWTEGPLCESAK